MKKKLRIIFLVLAVICFLAAAGFFAYRMGWLSGLFPKDDTFDKYKNPSSSQTSSQSGEPELPENPINFAELQAQNPDVCGYIRVDGIDTIDYPIMHSAPDLGNESFYLDHDWLKNSKFAGSIYIQNYNHTDFSDFATIIYGHNMLNGSMFGQLKKFRNADFFNANRNIYIYTPGHSMRYEIISAFVYDDRHILYAFDFYRDDDRDRFAQEVTSPKSLTKNVLEGATVQKDDKLIVLSTCTSNDSERYLVVGKLVEDTVTK